MLDKGNGKLMEYQRMMKNPKYCQLYCNSYAKYIGRLSQGMPGLVDGNEKNCFIEKTDVPVDRWRDVRYGIVVVDYRPEKRNTYRT